MYVRCGNAPFYLGRAPIARILFPGGCPINLANQAGYNESSITTIKLYYSKNHKNVVTWV